MLEGQVMCERLKNQRPFSEVLDTWKRQKPFVKTLEEWRLQDNVIMGRAVPTTQKNEPYVPTDEDIQFSRELDRLLNDFNDEWRRYEETWNPEDIEHFRNEIEESGHSGKLMDRIKRYVTYTKYPDYHPNEQLPSFYARYQDVALRGYENNISAQQQARRLALLTYHKKDAFYHKAKETAAIISFAVIFISIPLVALIAFRPTPANILIN